MIMDAVFGHGFQGANQYRYSLDRIWNDVHNPKMRTWILLNPSTADEYQDDPTIRRCINFSKRDGMDGLTIVNLFAHRATDPKVMKAAVDPIGPQNDKWILDAAQYSKDVVAGWGTHGHFKGRSVEVCRLLKSHNIQLMCLRQTQSGHPGHPLYVKGDTELIDYSASVYDRI